MKIKSQAIYILFIILLLASGFIYCCSHFVNQINNINATDFEKTLLIMLFFGMIFGAFHRK
jgi:hypothetical protein